MLLFQWNSLRVGDPVIVHDDAPLTHPHQEGTVRIVETRFGANDIAVRLANGVLVRPRRGAVHSVETGSRDCWRCHMLTAGNDAATRQRLGVPDLVPA